MHKWTERRWRHLDICQFETIIEASVPSAKYRDGTIEEVAVPWADRYQRFTKLLEQAVVMWLEACGNVDKAATTMRLDWQTVNRIMERAVERGLLRREEKPIKKAGVDKKSFRRGHVITGAGLTTTTLDVGSGDSFALRSAITNGVAGGYTNSVLKLGDGTVTLTGWQRLQRCVLGYGKDLE